MTYTDEQWEAAAKKKFLKNLSKGWGFDIFRNEAKSQVSRSYWVDDCVQVYAADVRADLESISSLQADNELLRELILDIILAHDRDEYPQQFNALEKSIEAARVRAGL